MTQQHGPAPDAHLEEVAEWHPIEGTPAKKKVAIGCSIGATIETYDFIGFGTAAALYFNHAFFPSSDPLSGTLLAFATLGIGFAVRPLGGIVGGYLGDKIGRKPVLVLNTGAAAAIILSFIVSYTVCQNSLAGVQGAWFSELFATKTRTTGASLAYQLSAVVSGFTPLIATALFATFGWMGPALLFSGYGLLGLVAAVLTRETWGRADREEVAVLQQALTGPSTPHPLPG